jgi:hypothetical protein
MLELLVAAGNGDIETIKRLPTDDANVTYRSPCGLTALLLASLNGRATTVEFLLEQGASITEKCSGDWSALLLASLGSHYALMEYLLQAAGASMMETTYTGNNVWTLLVTEGTERVVALASLLKTMVMLDDAPPEFVANLSPVHAELSTRGRHLRAQLPSYLEQQWAMVIEHCPIPTVLQSIVSAYVKTTPADMWTDGLRVEAPRLKRPRALLRAEAGKETGKAIAARSLRLREFVTASRAM